MSDESMVDDGVEDAEYAEVADLQEESVDEEDRWSILTAEGGDTFVTSVWLADISFPVTVTNDDGEEVQSYAKGLFATTTKDKLIDRIIGCIRVPEADFDITEYTTKVQAIKAFFEEKDSDRNLFVGVVPVE
tara:strand:- start:2422 stop:2817 length:396 start_codon:yes stop_codon:yes gene_type:complete